MSSADDLDPDMEPGAAATGRGYLIRSQFFPAPALPGSLYVLATPIGNLGDITIRALDTLSGADVVACEDTRVTRKLLARYGIRAKVTAYHEHSGPEAHGRILDDLANGRSVALVSDAGTPLISDPGWRLVVDAAAAGHAVVPIPGPSAVMTALSGAGLPTEAFLFVGFLPSKAAARRKRLAALAEIPATLVVFESPNRIGACLADAAAELGHDREAALCRELTKLHETFDRGSLAALADRYTGGETRGEIVLVVAPPTEAREPEARDVDELIRVALRTMPVKQAAQHVSELTGLPRRAVYQMALAQKDRALQGDA